MIRITLGSACLLVLVGAAWVDPPMPDSAWAAANAPDVAQDAKAAEWPQWRGPNRDGISPDKGLLQEWPKDGPKLLWEVDHLGNGYSSIVIAGNTIYTMGDRNDEQMLIALELKDGKEKWAVKIGRKYDEPRMPGGPGGPRCTPAVSGDLVFCISAHGDFVCVNTEGKEQWRKSFTDDYRGQKPQWGFCESPLVDGDQVVVTPGGRDAAIVAFNKKTGEEIWKANLSDAAHYSSIVVTEVGGIRQYVQLTSRGHVGVAAKDGKVLWKYDKASVRRMGANVPTPLVKDEYVFCVTGYQTGGGLVKLTVDKDTVTVKEEYFERELTNKHGGVVLVDGHLYGGRDETPYIYCADFKTGEIKWKKSDQNPSGSGSAAIVYADGCLYIRFANGNNVLVPTNPKEYKETGVFKTPHKGRANSWAHPVVCGGKLYLREQNWLMCYDVKAK